MKIDKVKLVNIIKIITGILFLAQPFFDIIKTSKIHDIQVFGLSFFEIFNIILVFVIGILAILHSEKKKRLFRYVLFAICFLIYFVLHCYNMTLFNNNIYPKHSLNFFVEFYYLYKTFMNPLILMISLYYVGVDKKYLIRLVQIYSLIISGVIIISNVFHFGYVAYGDDLQRCVKSIFEWFTFDNISRYSFYELTCRGLFYSANQMSSVTFMILPILFYSSYKNKKAIDYMALICLIISMYMLGTKVATFGVLAVFAFFYIIYIFFIYYNKIVKNGIKLNSIYKISLIFIFSLILFFFSPRFNELKYIGNAQSSVKIIENNLSSIDKDTVKFNNEWDMFKQIDCYNMDKATEDNFINFFDEYSGYMGVSQYIINSYDSNSHPGFWCDYLQNSSSNNYRVLKTSILGTIYEENENELDKYFGLGYNLNYIYTESDYSYQFYSYGIIGCIIFLGGYFVAFFGSIFRMFKYHKRLFNFETILLLVSPVIAVCVAYFSGHVLERTIPLLTLSMICSISLINTRKIAKK